MFFFFIFPGHVKLHLAGFSGEFLHLKCSGFFFPLSIYVCTFLLVRRVKNCLLLGNLLGVTDVGPDVVALVSYVTQERLRELKEKISAVAEHRRTSQKVQINFNFFFLSSAVVFI